MSLDSIYLGPALLFCPGDRPERFPKASAAADTAVIDLEDGVAAPSKDKARADAIAYLASTPERVAVRINRPTTARGRDDAAALLEAGGRVLVLPKTESAAEVDAIMGLATAADDLQLVVTIETAQGVMALPEILARPGVSAVSWGPYDLAADMGLRAVRDATDRLLPPLTHARDHILLCAAAARVSAFDTVTTEMRDPEILSRDAGDAAMLGFHGKFAIHPSQVDPIRRSFRPEADEVARCRKLLALASSQAVFVFEGEMIDEPALLRARRTVALADRTLRGGS